MHVSYFFPTFRRKNGNAAQQASVNRHQVLHCCNTRRIKIIPMGVGRLYFRTQTLKINFRQAAYQTAGWDGANMDELIGRLASKAGIDSAVAEKTIGIVLGFLRNEGPSDKVQ